MMKAFFAVTLILVVKLLAAEKTSYTGYKLYSVTIPDENALELVHMLEDNDPEVFLKFRFLIVHAHFFSMVFFVIVQV